MTILGQILMLQVASILRIYNRSLNFCNFDIDLKTNIQ